MCSATIRRSPRTSTARAWGGWWRSASIRTPTRGPTSPTSTTSPRRCTSSTRSNNTLVTSEKVWASSKTPPSPYPPLRHSTLGCPFTDTFNFFRVLVFSWEISHFSSTFSIFYSPGIGRFYPLRLGVWNGSWSCLCSGPRCRPVPRARRATTPRWASPITLSSQTASATSTSPTHNRTGHRLEIAIGTATAAAASAPRRTEGVTTTTTHGVPITAARRRTMTSIGRHGSASPSAARRTQLPI